MITLTAVQPPGRFGSLVLDGNNVKSFVEKPKGDNYWINGGFFVSNKEIFNSAVNNLPCEVIKNLNKDFNNSQFAAYGFYYDVDSGKLSSVLEHLKDGWNESENGGPNFDDSESIEWYLTETCGHRLGDIHWMTHQNPEIVTP